MSDDALFDLFVEKWGSGYMDFSFSNPVDEEDRQHLRDVLVFVVARALSASQEGTNAS